MDEEENQEDIYESSVDSGNPNPQSFLFSSTSNDLDAGPPVPVRILFLCKKNLIKP